MRHPEQAGEVSDRHAFPQGREGCARREAEKKEVISKQAVSRIQFPEQRARRLRALLGADVVASGTAGTRKGARLPAGGLRRWGREPGV